jgi:hypothetical protein
VEGSCSGVSGGGDLLWLPSLLPPLLGHHIHIPRWDCPSSWHMGKLPQVARGFRPSKLEEPWLQPSSCHLALRHLKRGTGTPASPGGGAEGGNPVSPVYSYLSSRSLGRRPRNKGGRGGCGRVRERRPPIGQLGRLRGGKRFAQAALQPPPQPGRSGCLGGPAVMGSPQKSRQREPAGTTVLPESPHTLPSTIFPETASPEGFKKKKKKATFTLRAQKGCRRDGGLGPADAGSGVPGQAPGRPPRGSHLPPRCCSHRGRGSQTPPHRCPAWRHGFVRSRVGGPERRALTCYLAPGEPGDGGAQRVCVAGTAGSARLIGDRSGSRRCAPSARLRPLLLPLPSRAAPLQGRSRGRLTGGAAGSEWAWPRDGAGPRGPGTWEASLVGWGLKGVGGISWTGRGFRGKGPAAEFTAPTHATSSAPTWPAGRACSELFTWRHQRLLSGQKWPHLIFNRDILFLGRTASQPWRMGVMVLPHSLVHSTSIM